MTITKKLAAALVVAAALGAGTATSASAAPAPDTQGALATSLAQGQDWSKGAMANFRQTYK